MGRTSKFKFKKIKPVYVGWYSCNYGYGSTYGSLYWNGEAFGEFRFWMFKEFVFNRHYTVKHFFNNTYVYNNMNAHYIKESGDVMFIPEFNEIMEHWKLQSLKRG